jgi:hypothetical protein
MTGLMSRGNIGTLTEVGKQFLMMRYMRFGDELNPKTPGESERSTRGGAGP